MKHINLGVLEVSRVGLGTMGMSTAYTGAGTDDAELIRTTCCLTSNPPGTGRPSTERSIWGLG